MRISVSQRALSSALSVVLKAISTRTTIDILKSVFLEANDNTLTIIGNDLNIGIETTIDVDVIEAGKMLVNGRMFADIIRKLPDETIDITSTDNNAIHINCLNSDFNLAGDNPAEFPELPLINPDVHSMVDKFMLSDMIRQTIFATSHDESRPILTGALFDISDDHMTMVAIDLYRVALKKIAALKQHPCHVVIPAKALSELLKILTSDTQGTQVLIYTTDKYIKFSIDNVVLIARLLEGEFINYQQILPKDYKTKLTCSKAMLYQAIDRASLIANQGKNVSLLFDISEQYLSISSNAELGNVTEKVSIDLEGPTLKIGFNPRYWLDVLKVIEHDNITIELTTNISPCIIRPEDDDSYTYLLLPVRILN